MCKHWIELDDDGGSGFEYCRAEKRRCTCAGNNGLCDYGQYEPDPKTQTGDFILKCMAMPEGGR